MQTSKPTTISPPRTFLRRIPAGFSELGSSIALMFEVARTLATGASLHRSENEEERPKTKVE